MAAARQQRNGGNSDGCGGKYNNQLKKGTDETAMATEMAVVTYSDDNDVNADAHDST